MAKPTPSTTSDANEYKATLTIFDGAQQLDICLSSNMLIYPRILGAIKEALLMQLLPPPINDWELSKTLKTAAASKFTQAISSSRQRIRRQKFVNPTRN